MAKAAQDSLAVSPAHYAEPLAAVGDGVYSWLDILASAEVLGRLTSIRRDVEQGTAAVRHAAGLGLELDHEQVQQAANDLRYRLNLITGAETEDWLGARYLSLDDLYEFLARQLWAAHFAAAEMPAVEAPRQDVLEALWPQALFAGRLAELVAPFFQRVIASRLIVSRADLGDDALVRARAELCRCLGTDDLAAGAAGCWFVGPNEIEEHVLRQARFMQLCDEIAGPDHCARRLPSLRPQLLYVGYLLASFDQADAAQEAQLCVSADGEDLAAVAERAGGRVEAKAGFVEDMPEAERRKLVSARIGECLPPASHDGKTFAVILVTSKQEPDLADAAVQERVRDRIVAETFARYLHEDVRWLKFPLY